MNVGHLFLFAGVGLVVAAWWYGRGLDRDPGPVSALPAPRRLPADEGDALVAAYGPVPEFDGDVVVYPAATSDRATGGWCPVLEVRRYSTTWAPLCDVDVIEGAPLPSMDAAMTEARRMADVYRSEHEQVTW